MGNGFRNGNGFGRIGVGKSRMLRRSRELPPLPPPTARGGVKGQMFWLFGIEVAPDCRWLGGGCLRGGQDLGKDPGQIREHATVREAQEPDAQSPQIVVALLVSFSLIVMHATVHFNGEPDRVAVEVDDEAVDHTLPAEVQPAEPVPLHLCP